MYGGVAQKMELQHALIAAITVLSGVVVFLFGLFQGQVKGMEKRLVDCETDRRELWKHVNRIESTSCSDHTCDERRPLQHLSLIARPQQGST